MPLKKKAIHSQLILTDPGLHLRHPVDLRFVVELLVVVRMQLPLLRRDVRRLVSGGRSDFVRFGFEAISSSYNTVEK